MNSTSENNKRIAKNTLFLYIRQILILAVSLYTVRIVLSVLGEENYGIYNVVGGFVSMFSILSGALSVAISRFITFEMGKTDVTISRLQHIFSSSLIIQVFIGLIICLLIGTIGVWFVEYKMVIPQERLNVTLYVLLFSTLSFFINLLSVPYNALIIAHEQMKAFAYISIVEVVMKLVIAYILIVASWDKLLIYAFCMVIVSLIIRSIYAVYCKKHFEECHFVWGFDKHLLSQMFIFSSWAFLGNGAIVLKDQGTTILLNLFGGPVVNAAQGIAMQIKNAVFSFVSNFMTASAPQITKSFAAGEMDKMFSLTFMTCKYGFYLLLLMVVPIFASIDYILKFWLVEVPEHTTNFVILVLIYSLAECYATPLVRGVLADGKIRNYEIATTIIYIINVLVSYICLKIGFNVEVVFGLNIIFKIFVTITLIIHSYLRYNFPVKPFIKEVIIPTIMVFSLSYILIYILPHYDNIEFLTFLIQSVLLFFITAILIYSLGMNKKERQFLNKFITDKIIRRVNFK